MEYINVCVRVSAYIYGFSRYIFSFEDGARYQAKFIKMNF